MIEIIMEEEFNNYAIKHDLSSFFQSSYWGKLKQSVGWKYYLVGYKENNELKGSSLLLAKKIPLFNKYIYYSPRGFLIDYSNLDFVTKYTKEITKFVKKNKGIFIKINPLITYQQRDINGDMVENGIKNKELVNHLKKLGYIHTGFSINYGKDLEPRWISVLDLKSKTEQQILKDMRGTTRWGIQNSYKHGLKLVQIDESRIEEFKKLMNSTGERRGFIDRPLSYYKKMYETFKDKIKIILVELNTNEYLDNLEIQYKDTMEKLNKAKKEGLKKELESQIEAIKNKKEEMIKIKEENQDTIVVAGGLFMTFGRQVISLFGASYREFMKFNGQYFLNFEMIKYALNNNYDKFNFYGITGEFDESSPMYGLFNFKRGFNAEVVELIGEFTYITDKFYYHIYNIMFSIYKKLKKVLKW